MSGSPASYGSVKVTSGPKRTRHGRTIVPNGPPGVTATGMMRACVIATINGSGGVPAPVRNQVGASGTATRCPARRRGREVARAVGDRTEPPERSSPRTAAFGAPDDAQPASGGALHRNAERGRLEDAEAAVRDERGRAFGRHVFLAADLDAHERRHDRLHEIGEMRVEPEPVEGVTPAEPSPQRSRQRLRGPTRSMSSP